MYNLFDQFNYGEGDTGTTFRDMMTLMLLSIILLFVIILPHINPPAEKDEEEITAPGNMVVELYWPDELDVDLDLWVRAPGDIPVGYSNKGGRYFNLVRDDLGHRNDNSGRNYEIAFSRGLPVGEYIINVHVYRIFQRVELPFEFRVVVKIINEDRRVTAEVVRDVTVTKSGEEHTVMRFEVDNNGYIVPNSMNNVRVSLRNAHNLGNVPSYP
jgi:hypothetical protein